MSCPRSITFVIPGKLGIGVQITATENAGNLDFTVDVLGSSKHSADLRGLFFQFNESDLSGLRVLGGDGLITGTQIQVNSVINLGQGVNMNGAANPFDVGIAFGSPGKGQDLINGPIHFTLDATQNLTLDDIAHLQFGARLTSVGDKITTIAPAAPDAHDDAFNIFEDGASGLNNPSKIPTPLVFNVLANDTDADNDALVVTGFDGGPSHGTATISADGHNVIYTPNLDYSGPDSFEYCISDGHGGQDHAVVNVNVAAVADAPTLTYQVHAGATVNQILIDVTATQNDADSSEFIDQLFASVAGGLPAGVTVTPGSINPGTEPDQIVQQFVVTLPLDTDTNFNLDITAISKEVSNGDTQTATVTIPIVNDFNSTTTPVQFTAENQSIWNTGDQFTFQDDRFIGINTGPFDELTSRVGKSMRRRTTMSRSRPTTTRPSMSS
jgi:hypothetical protein